MGEALYTGHGCRKTGAEALTAGGTEVAVTQILIRRGKRTVLYYGQEPPLASSLPIAARPHRPELCTVTPLDPEEMELLKATVERLESKLEGPESDRSLCAMQDLQRLERFQSCGGSDEEAH